MPAGPRGRCASRATGRPLLDAASAAIAGSSAGWSFRPDLPRTRCALCAGVPALAVCADCGVEERLYADGHCVRCALALRARELLGEPGGPFEPLYEAIVSAPQPYSVHNWLRSSGPAAILKQLVAGTMPLTHEALDRHLRRRSADHLRHLLVASGLLPPRDEALVELETWVARCLGEVDDAQRVGCCAPMPRGGCCAGPASEQRPPDAPRTPTAHAKKCLNAAISFLEFLGDRNTSLASCTQADMDDWFTRARRAPSW